MNCMYLPALLVLLVLLIPTTHLLSVKLVLWVPCIMRIIDPLVSFYWHYYEPRVRGPRNLTYPLQFLIH